MQMSFEFCPPIEAQKNRNKTTCNLANVVAASGTRHQNRIGNGFVTATENVCVDNMLRQPAEKGQQQEQEEETERRGSPIKALLLPLQPSVVGRGDRQAKMGVAWCSVVQRDSVAFSFHLFAPLPRSLGAQTNEH